jgi:hypothetical protein
MGLARVDRDPHARLDCFGPGRACKESAQLDGGRHRIRRTPEHGNR